MGNSPALSEKKVTFLISATVNFGYSNQHGLKTTIVDFQGLDFAPGGILEDFI
jgi:hypothetical protein